MDKNEFKMALKELNWSQGEFSRRTGLGRNSVSRWMVGKTRKIPCWVGSYIEMALKLKRLSENIWDVHGF